jgi:hypothetical protein
VRRAARRVAASLALLPLFAAPSVAHADEVDGETEGVRVGVNITPLECVADCGGGQQPGGGMPVTGLTFDASTFVWLAVALLAAGVAVLVWRRVAASSREATVRDASGAYYVVSGRHADAAEAGLPPSTTTAIPSRGDAPDRRVERGGSQCPNR